MTIEEILKNELEQQQTQLELNRSKQKELEDEIERLEYEESYIISRIEFGKRIQDKVVPYVPSCVPAPVEYNNNHFIFKESEKETVGIAVAIETESTTGDKINRVLHLYKKNKNGLPVGNDRLTVHLDHLLELKDYIKKRGKVHMEEINGLNLNKYNILTSYLSESYGDFTHVKYGKVDNSPKKYLYWDES